MPGFKRGSAGGFEKDTELNNDEGYPYPYLGKNLS